MIYNAIQFMFFPELTPQWLIRVIGGLFVIYAIGYALDIHTIYLRKNIDKLNELLKDKRSVLS